MRILGPIPAGKAGSARPLIDDRRLRFVEDARDFARRRRGDLAFRFLKLFTRAGDAELDLIVAKIYCDSLPQRAGGQEPVSSSFLKLIAFPFLCLLKKRLLWNPEPAVDFDFESVDEAHFDRWFSAVHKRVNGSKRVTMSATILGTIAPRSWLLLLAAPLFAPALLLLARGTGTNIIAAYRRALGLYAAYDGYFRRYPCRHFVTYSDELNHPCRQLAFRQNCPGSLVATQNGERIYHPAFAFGALDAYLVYGRFMERLCPDLGMSVGKVVPVGAMNLDMRSALLERLRRQEEPVRYDVVLADQGLPPHNGLDAGIGEAFEKVFAYLGALKNRRPELRVAFQLRDYRGQPQMKELILKVFRRSAGEGVEIIENYGQDESYATIFRSRLVLCFNSTIGYESFFIRPGVRALFVNLAGDPCQILCLDPRFQHYDPSADYGLFERAIIEALALDLQGPPEAARERHLVPDGNVAQRVAEFLRSLPCS